jgi:hypothetical protein
MSACSSDGSPLTPDLCDVSIALRLHCFDMNGQLTCDHELGGRVSEGRCFHYRNEPWDQQQSIIPV